MGSVEQVGERVRNYFAELRKANPPERQVNLLKGPSPCTITLNHSQDSLDLHVHTTRATTTGTSWGYRCLDHPETRDWLAHQAIPQQQLLALHAATQEDGDPIATNAGPAVVKGPLDK